MYGEGDITAIDRSIRGTWLWLAPTLVILLGLFITSLIVRIEWLAYASAAGLAVMACFGFGYCLWPKLRYRRFLTDMGEGLSREMAGRIVEISETVELQDGARVLPVRIWLDSEDDERIIYLNVSKRDRFPGEGEWVRLRLYGRHVAAVLDAREGGKEGKT